jgi:hypothetical protein
MTIPKDETEFVQAFYVYQMSSKYPVYERRYVKNLYVNQLGQVKLIKPEKNITKIVSPSIQNNTGYLIIKPIIFSQVQKKYIKQNLFLHRLVYFSFNKPDTSLYKTHVVHHINANKTDPRLINLDYISQSENLKEHYKEQSKTTEVYRIELNKHQLSLF